MATNLSFIKLKGCGYFNSPSSGKVFVKVKLFLKFCELFGWEVGPPRVVDSSSLTSEESLRFWCWK